MSILIVTHDSKVAGLCDRVCYMADGRITGEIEMGKYEIAQKQEREIKLSDWLRGHGWYEQILLSRKLVI